MRPAPGTTFFLIDRVILRLFLLAACMIARLLPFVLDLLGREGGAL